MEILIITFLLIALSLAVYHIYKNRQSISLNEVNLKYVLKHQHEAILSELEDHRLQVQDLLQTNSSLQAKYEFLNSSLEEKKKELQEWEEKLTEKFENLSNRLLRTNAEIFRKDSAVQLESVIKPFQDNFKNFQQRLQETHESRIKETENLKGELTRLGELNNQLSQDADNLTKALKLNPKMRGSWGEALLETLLEKAGLVKNQHYTREEAGKIDTLEEEGKGVRADVIINLPEKRHLIIDSKVALNAYLDFSGCDDEIQQQELLKTHTANIRKHIDTLHKKRYDQMYNINSPELVFMFCPLEGGLISALQHDVELYEYAINKNIVLVTSSTLFATLSVVGQLWQRNKQYENATKIAEEAGKLHDQVEKFLGDMNEINKHIQKAQDYYDSAAKRLSTGRNNVIRLTQKIADMGGKGREDGKLLEQFADEHQSLAS
jgi:DNA recombination protein RmuC